MKLEDLFHVKMPIIGMIHLRALPGAPAFSISFKHVLDTALTDAKALTEGGIDGFILENFGDVPFYPNKVPIHTIAYMTRIATEVKWQFQHPLGLNVLRNDARAAMAIASATDTEFIRVNIHTGCMVTDQGLIQGRAHETLRLRTLLQSKVQIFADVLVKHATPLGTHSLTQTAKDTYYRGKADALIVSGAETGAAPTIERVKAVKDAVPTVPVIVGSGVTPSNLETYLDYADGFIVGTWFKKDGVTTNPVNGERIRLLVDKIQEFR